MNESMDRLSVHITQKRLPRFLVLPRLINDGLPQGMMAVDQKLVSLVQALKVRNRRHLGEFAAFPAVAAPACQHQIPNAVEVHLCHIWLQHMRLEMIDIARIALVVTHNDIVIAIKAFALLIAVQRTSHRGYILPPKRFIDK